MQTLPAVPIVVLFGLTPWVLVLYETFDAGDEQQLRRSVSDLGPGVRHIPSRARIVSAPG